MRPARSNRAASASGPSPVPVPHVGPESPFRALSARPTGSRLHARSGTARRPQWISTSPTWTRSAALRRSSQRSGSSRTAIAATAPGFLRRSALAFWWPRSRRLVLAADRFGIRRLYYAATPEGIAFGSRVSVPLALPGTTSAVDPEAVYAYLNFSAIPAPQTIYRAIRRLPPGHLLEWEDGRLRVEPYWDMRYTERAISRTAASASLRRHTEEAVGDALRGADPKHTGAFLSGGTDSSTVVGLMTRLTGERVNAFSIGFLETRYDELQYAELAARHFDAAHYTRVVTADDALRCLPAGVEAYDEPFGNNSALPTFLCARQARETGMRLLLAGDGGDEIFGGHERYRREQILARYRPIPAGLRR